MSLPSLTIEEINKRKNPISRLTAIKFLESEKSKYGLVKMVLCKCSCGVIKKVRLSCMLVNTLSCGCYREEKRRLTIESIISRLPNSSRLTILGFDEC